MAIPTRWRFSSKDKMVLSIVVLLYMLYPTTLRQVFSMVACRLWVTQHF